MKICHVASCFPPSYGGVETFVYNLCKRQVERGYQVKVITSDRGKLSGKCHEWINGIEVIRYPEKYHLFEAPIIPRIALRLLREDYGILHVHGMVPTISDLALVVGKIKRKPIVLTYHYDAETPKYGAFGKLARRGYAVVARSVVKFADRIVATTKSYAKTSPVLSNILRKVMIISCGIDTKRFSPIQSYQDNNLKNKLGNHRILYVGKLIHYKGVDTLIKAFKIVITKFPSNCCLVIAGNGEQSDELKDLVKKLELCDRVIFVGNMSDELLLQHYRMSDLFVLPSLASRREAFGIVLLEAMACGLPVIASDIPGPNEVVENEENGLLVPPGNAEKLAEAIITILNNTARSEKKAHAAQIVKKRYDWSVIEKIYDNLYRSLVI